LNIAAVLPASFGGLRDFGDGFSADAKRSRSRISASFITGNRLDRRSLVGALQGTRVAAWCHQSWLKSFWSVDRVCLNCFGEIADDCRKKQPA
jgi:hypothetical protein